MKRTRSGYAHGNWQGHLNAGLSPREVQSVLLVANGNTHKQGALELGVAPSTFTDRIRNVMYKLKAARGPQAVSESIRKGIITPLSILMLFGIVLSSAMTNDIDIRRSVRPVARRQREDQHPDFPKLRGC